MGSAPAPPKTWSRPHLLSVPPTPGPSPAHTCPGLHTSPNPTTGPAPCLTVYVFLVWVGHQATVVPTVGDPVVVVILVAGVTLAIVV